MTYYLFTLRTVFDMLLNCCGIVLNDIPIKFLLVILYTAIAYFVGVVLHELGKILVDVVPCFRTFDINTRIYKNDMYKRPKGLLFRRIKYEFQQELKQNCIVADNKNEIIEFAAAINELKYNDSISTNRIDKYHSVYALSRSLCLCFLGHSIILVCVNINIFLLIFDAMMTILFFERSYRYFYGWVKNVYFQYYKNIKKANK